MASVLRRNRVIIIFALIVSSIILILFITIHPGKSVAIKNGVLDLTAWDYNSNISLTGEWAFYWHDFIDFNDLKENPKADAIVPVPSTWNNYKINGKRLPGQGYATYLLHVVGVRPEHPLAIRIKPFSSSYEFFIDDKLVAKSGVVGTTKNSCKPQYRVQTVRFNPDNDHFDIIIHISNYTHARGGAAWCAPKFGIPEQVERASDNAIYLSFLLLGAYIIMAIFLLFIFIVYRSKGALFLLILCLINLLRDCSYGEFLLTILVPDIPYSTIIRLDYSYVFEPCLYVLFIDSEYPDFISKNFKYFLYVLICIHFCSVVLLPVAFLTQILTIQVLISLLISLYAAFRAIRIKSNRLIGSNFLLGGLLIICFCLIYDTMVNQMPHQTDYVEMAPWGIYLSLCALGCSLIFRYKHFSDEKIQLLNELNSAHERERKLELRLLKSQIRPHFINNTLTTIFSLARTDYSKSRALLTEFSRYLTSCYNVGELEDLVPLENELTLIRSYLALQQARYGSKLEINYDINEISILIPPLLLQPLVENSIIHGMKKDGIHILIYSKNMGGFVRIGVRDNGKGIGEDSIYELLSDNTGSEGLGIYNVNQRLKKIYNTSLHIESAKDGDTDIYMMIPQQAVCNSV